MRRKGRPPKGAGARITSVGFKVSPQEYKALERIAGALGLSVGSYARARALAEIPAAELVAPADPNQIPLPLAVAP